MAWWWFWMLLGAALAVAAPYGLAYLETVAERRGLLTRRAVAHQQFLAEQALQAQLQQTVTELFSAAREGQQ